jgi:hypothetical protein
MIDQAWRTRVTTFYKGAEAAMLISRASNEAPKIIKASEIEAEYVARPFDFADLQGKPEPAKWGPTYPKTASQAVEKWRMTSRGRELSSDEKRAYGQAVGEWIRGLNDVKPAARVSLKYSMPNYAAKARAAFAAQAEADKRAWAAGKSKNDRGETIAQAYARAMDEKAERLADPEAYAGKLKAAANRAAAEAARLLAPIGPKARARNRKLNIREAA